MTKAVNFKQYPTKSNNFQQYPTTHTHTLYNHTHTHHQLYKHRTLHMHTRTLVKTKADASQTIQAYDTSTTSHTHTCVSHDACSILSLIISMCIQLGRAHRLIDTLRLFLDISPLYDPLADVLELASFWLLVMYSLGNFLSINPCI